MQKYRTWYDFKNIDASDYMKHEILSTLKQSDMGNLLYRAITCLQTFAFLQINVMVQKMLRLSCEQHPFSTKNE